jgi:L-rhamnose-H+ transport protein
MGLLWILSVFVYGAASAQMAVMGPIVGWPLFMSVVIITANVWGLATGEWAGVGRGPRAIMLAGIAFLILGFCFVGVATRLK